MISANAVTSHSLLINLPIAAFLIVLALWVATHFQIEPVTPQKPRRRGGVVEAHGSQHGRVPATPFAAVLEGLAEAGTKAGKSWQEQVGSGVVESAWETLCGSILQEVRNATCTSLSSWEVSCLRSGICYQWQQSIAAG